MTFPEHELHFFQKFGLTGRLIERCLGEALSAGGDFADLYFESVTSTAISVDESLVKSASQGVSAGCGIRVVSGDRTGYAYTDDLSAERLMRAARTAALIASGPSKQSVAGFREAPKSSLYPTSAANTQPLPRLNCYVIAKDGSKNSRGGSGGGGRVELSFFEGDKSPEHFATEAARPTILQLNAVAAPAGDMEVVLGPGWPGVLLHEAVGHGLEADFNRKKTSAFAGLIGHQVASSKVTVVDNGTMPSRRGSLNVDDEGSPTKETVLIENGILKGYLSDKLSARLMGMADTGNGRRESYQHIPMPRMTNTYMLSGEDSPEDIVRSVKRGLYAVNFGGGQVDITSGKFVFSASEAYLIEDGKT